MKTDIISAFLEIRVNHPLHIQWKQMRNQQLANDEKGASDDVAVAPEPPIPTNETVDIVTLAAHEIYVAVPD